MSRLPSFPLAKIQHLTLVRVRKRPKGTEIVGFAKNGKNSFSMTFRLAKTILPTNWFLQFFDH